MKTILFTLVILGSIVAQNAFAGGSLEPVTDAEGGFGAGVTMADDGSAVADNDNAPGSLAAIGSMLATPRAQILIAVLLVALIIALGVWTSRKSRVVQVD